MRKLLFQLLVLFFSLNLSANTSERIIENLDFPNISILGPAVSDWATDVFMETQDGIHYSLSANLLEGGLKFRRDAQWNENWSADEFPSGVGIPGDGAVINVSTSGKYNNPIARICNPCPSE